MLDRRLAWISDRPVVTYAAAILAVALLFSVSLAVRKAKELDHLFGPTLELAPSTLSATLDPEGGMQPPGGEVPFRINFADIGPGGVTISVQFRFTDRDYRSGWISSPLVRLLGRSEISVDGRIERVVRAAATVPSWPQPLYDFSQAERWPRLEGLQSAFRPRRDAEMRVRAVQGPAETSRALLDTTFPIKISSRPLAVLVALSPLLVIVLLATRLVRGASVWSRLSHLMAGPDRRVSLLQFQVLCWTIIITSVLMYFFVLTRNLDIPAGVLGALAIVGVALLAEKTFTEQELVKGTSEAEAPSPEPGFEKDGIDRPADYSNLVMRDGQFEFARAQLFAVTVFVGISFLVDVAVSARPPGIAVWTLLLLGASNGFYLAANVASQAVLARIRTRSISSELTKNVQGISSELTKSVQAIMLGPEAARYAGFVHLGLTSGSESVRSCKGTLRFSNTSGGEDWLPVRIEEGAETDKVFFSAVIRSDDPAVTEIERDVPVPASGERELTFELQFDEPGPHHIWITILQANRLVQVIEADWPSDREAERPRRRKRP